MLTPGYSARDLPAETALTATIAQIHEGTNQIQRMVMARQRDHVPAEPVVSGGRQPGSDGGRSAPLCVTVVRPPQEHGAFRIVLGEGSGTAELACRLAVLAELG